MKEKLQLNVYITYLISGYIWLATLLLLLNIIRQFGYDILSFGETITLENIVSPSIILFTIPFAFTMGVAFKPFANGLNRRLGRVLLGSEKDIHVDNALRCRITEKASQYSSYRDYYDLLEFQLDDLMSVNGVRNSWSKYYYLADFMKQIYLSGVFFSMLVMINYMLLGNVLLFAFVMFTAIFFLYACRLSYIANMKEYINEVQMSFLFYHSINTADTIKLKDKRGLNGDSQSSTA